jgi:hypothetical protein
MEALATKIKVALYVRGRVTRCNPRVLSQPRILVCLDSACFSFGDHPSRLSSRHAGVQTSDNNDIKPQTGVQKLKGAKLPAPKIPESKLPLLLPRLVTSRGRRASTDSSRSTPLQIFPNSSFPIRGCRGRS